MFTWWIGILLILVVALVVATRRPAKRGHGAIGQDLFEGILPCALTGSSPRPKSRDGWELRWAEVTNLTPAGSDTAVRGGEESGVVTGKRGAEAEPETVPVAVDSSAGDTVVRSAP